jgi:O-acetyl-ADP-ribose deacetylase (regulator of RNase III)
MPASSPAADWRATAQRFGRVLLYRGDITKLDTTAIVNAANSSLLGGGGVDGAIHRAGGPAILEECRHLRKRLYPFGISIGQAVATTGGQLPATYVIHTAGPVWHGGYQHEAEELAACYQHCLQIAAGRQLASVAFPGISTGIYGYPKPEATAIAVREVRQFLAQHAWPQEVVFVVFDQESEQLYKQALQLPAN